MIFVKSAFPFAIWLMNRIEFSTDNLPSWTWMKNHKKCQQKYWYREAVHFYLPNQHVPLGRHASIFQFWLMVYVVVQNLAYHFRWPALVSHIGESCLRLFLLPQIGAKKPKPHVDQTEMSNILHYYSAYLATLSRPLLSRWSTLGTDECNHTNVTQCNQKEFHFCEFLSLFVNECLFVACSTI